MIPSWLPDFTIVYFIFSLVYAARLYERGIKEGYRQAIADWRIAGMPLPKFDKLEDYQLDELFVKLDHKLFDEPEDNLDKRLKFDKPEDKQ